MAAVQTIVVTGSTRGIGKGLAADFLRRGHNVVVTGRTRGAVDRAVQDLGGGERVLGIPCDVRSFPAVQAVWDAAVARFGRVDVWINNAALATDRLLLAEVPPEQIALTIDTNLTGSLYGARVALAGMVRQGGGRLYFFEGFGSNDMVAPGLTVYATTKRALTYLTRSLAREYRDTPVLVGSLSPGMVVTDLLVSSSRLQDKAQWARAKRLMNILADPVEVVTPWLAGQALDNTRQGARIEWLTRGKAALRFLGAAFRRRDIISPYEQAMDAGSAPPR
jgi:NAD(P)-dependent dehydrogenase (short-subunit alcohol dehydrogenase family)